MYPPPVRAFAAPPSAPLCARRLLRSRLRLQRFVFLCHHCELYDKCDKHEDAEEQQAKS